MTRLGMLLKGLIVVPPLVAFVWLVAEVTMSLFGAPGLMNDWAVLGVFLALAILRAACFDLPLPRRLDRPAVRTQPEQAPATGRHWAQAQPVQERISA